MKVEILGMGCAKCQRQAMNVKRAVKDLGIDVQVEKVEDIEEITRRGVMITPALVVDGQLRSSGRVVGVDELKRMLSE